PAPSSCGSRATSAAQLLQPAQELGSGLPSRGTRYVQRLELLRHQCLRFGRVVNTERHDEHRALGDIARAVDRVAPLAPEIALVAALGVGGDDGQEVAAARDVAVDLAVVIVAAFQPVEVEP